jgi:hypothetical protein
MQTRHAIVALLVTVLCSILLSSAPAQQQWGQKSAPAWGQIGAPAWGQYQGTIGPSGWQYNKTLQPTDPKGAILSPNQTSGGPGTGSIYSPPDTRLLGRTAP